MLYSLQCEVLQCVSIKFSGDMLWCLQCELLQCVIIKFSGWSKLTVSWIGICSQRHFKFSIILSHRNVVQLLYFVQSFGFCTHCHILISSIWPVPSSPRYYLWTWHQVCSHNFYKLLLSSPYLSVCAIILTEYIGCNCTDFHYFSNQNFFRFCNWKIQVPFKSHKLTELFMKSSVH